MHKISILVLLLITVPAQARPWPETFSRQQYHRYYVENRFVSVMPFSIQNIKSGKPAYLSFITSYVYFPIKGKDVEPYMPPSCGTLGNIPFYEHWTYMIALDRSSFKGCE